MKTETSKILALTETATQEIARMVKEDGRPDIGLRIGVKGGGCSGLSYVFELGTQQENDRVQTEGLFNVFVDPKSSLYLKDVVLEYEAGLKDHGFKFNNPNATNTCGCGESFSV